MLWSAVRIDCNDLSISTEKGTLESLDHFLFLIGCVSFLSITISANIYRGKGAVVVGVMLDEVLDKVSR